MNEIIENIAVQAGFIKDKYGLYWDNDDNAEGVDLERFAELIIQECTNFIDNWEEYQIKMSEQVHGFIPPTGGAKHLKAHFGVE